MSIDPEPADLAVCLNKEITDPVLDWVYALIDALTLPLALRPPPYESDVVGVIFAPPDNVSDLYRVTFQLDVGPL